MSDPITFTSASARFRLPFLFSGQTQKELFVNEAHALLDALLHAAVEGEADTPPAAPAEGESWLVGGAPTGTWTDHAGEFAARNGDVFENRRGSHTGEGGEGTAAGGGELRGFGVVFCDADL